MAAPETSGLEGRLAQLESQVRSLMASNWTDLASVVDAAGNPVPLSSLAFGQVAATIPATGAVSLSVPAGQTQGVSSGPSVFQPANPTLQVDALVKGGRLRIDWASLLAVGGPSGAQAYMAMSYSLDYLGPDGSKGSVSTRVTDPDYYRAIQVRDAVGGGGGQVGAFGSWYMHTGLTPGWYRATALWLLGVPVLSATPAVTNGSADYPRLAATPF